MMSAPSDALSPDAISATELRDYLQGHWQRLQGGGVALSQPRRGKKPVVTAEALYACLTSCRFCRQRPEDVAGFLAVIQHAMAQGAPIPVVVGHGPLKNPNNCPVSQVDWAEFFTLSQLAHLVSAVEALYPPGLAITLFVDDARAEFANAIPSQWTATYLASLRALVADSGAGRFIHQVVSLKEAYETHGVRSFVPEAEARVRLWEEDPANEAALQVMHEHAIRNMPGVDDLDPALREAQAVAAAHRYRLYYQAEVLAGLWSLPQTLYGRLSAHAGFWQLFTLRKGSVTQPWQGRGCLKRNPNGKLEPFLMTRSRVHQHTLLGRIDSGLPLSGFSQIEVFAENPPIVVTREGVEEARKSPKPFTPPYPTLATVSS